MYLYHFSLHVGEVLTLAKLCCWISSQPPGTLCYHHDDISAENFKIYSKVCLSPIPAELVIDKPSQLSYVAAPMFALSIGCAQVSVLFSYWCLASIDWAPKVVFYISMVIVSAATLVMTALLFARPGNSSLNIVSLSIFAAPFNIVMDIVLAVLPMFQVFNIQMPSGKKVLVLGFFSLGLITASVSIARLVLLDGLQDSSDFTWDAALANMISFLGMNIHVIFACLPAVRKFFRDKCPSTGPDYLP
ncbi:hypothetical protein LY76DRAFT_673452 [Colletotrichum caudatum]|nr:hypothetical protein LY76DRAFT_673452 [Colletotrichum caudatum]